MPAPTWARLGGAAVAVLLVSTVTAATAATGEETAPATPTPSTPTPSTPSPSATAPSSPAPSTSPRTTEPEPVGRWSDEADVAPRSVAPAAASGPHVLLVGDSFSSRYDDVDGSEQRAWWSFLREDLDATMTTSVESGSGMLMRGASCTGTRFGDRLTRSFLTAQDPDLVIVQGAANDIGHCVDGKRKRLADKPSVIRDRVRVFLKTLAQDASAVGLKRKDVYVTAFWGSQDAKGRTIVATAYRDYAKRYGMTYVSVPALQHRHTLDATGEVKGDTLHPNLAGSRYLYYAFMAGAGLEDLVVR